MCERLFGVLYNQVVMSFTTRYACSAIPPTLSHDNDDDNDNGVDAIGQIVSTDINVQYWSVHANKGGLGECAARVAASEITWRQGLQLICVPAVNIAKGASPRGQTCHEEGGVASDRRPAAVLVHGCSAQECAEHSAQLGGAHDPRFGSFGVLQVEFGLNVEESAPNQA